MTCRMYHNKLQKMLDGNYLLNVNMIFESHNKPSGIVQHLPSYRDAVGHNAQRPAWKAVEEKAKVGDYWSV